MIKGLLKDIYQSLRSLRLTATVIVLLIAVYFAGLLLPQKWMFDSKIEYDAWQSENLFYRLLDIIGFTDIYISPVTLFLLALFFVNLLVVIAGRVPVILGKSYIRGAPAVPGRDAIKSASAFQERGMSTAQVGEALSRACGKLGYYFAGNLGGGVYAAVRNRLSPLGFLLFHISFLFCLVGGLMVSYTRFSGDLVLTEGQAFEGDMRQFRRITKEPKVFKALPALGLKLLDVHPVYDKDVPSRLEATLMVRDAKETRQEFINVNEPIRRGALTIHASKIGISPLVEITGPSDQFIDGAYVSLDVLSGQLDSFKFETDPRYNFIVQFYPDYEVVDGLERSRSPEIRNPVFHLAIEKEGIREFEGTVRPDELVKFGIFKLRIGEIRYWVEFLVIREYGTYPLFMGFAMACIGLIMRLVFYQRRMHILIEPAETGSVIYIHGRSEFFPHSFEDEKERFMIELKKILEEVPG